MVLFSQSRYLCSFTVNVFSALLSYCAQKEAISWRLKAVVIFVEVRGEGWEGRRRKRGGLGLKRRAIGEKKDNTRIKIYEVKAKPMKH